LVPDDALVDPELAELAELARKGVHKSYRLAPFVERGVAFHYGNMPSPLRLEIERLFKSGKIKFLICTSTLIEGVNLSCRTIIVRGPRKGTGNPMDASDFWNLAGRAGRWGNEFQGNIICIDTKNSSAWPDGVPERSRQPIKRESDLALEQAPALSDYLAVRLAAGTIPRDIDPSFEPVSAYLLSTFMREGTLAV
jgi:replicative superfamily II helicase